MHLSHTAILAIVAVVDIAIHGQERPVRRDDIGPRHGLSERYFEPILQVLSGSGILSATRGRTGGYRLARAPSLITVAEVVRATDDIAAGKIKSSIAKRIVLPAIKDAQLAFAKALQDITIADLVRSVGPGASAGLGYDGMGHGINENRPLGFRGWLEDLSGL